MFPRSMTATVEYQTCSRIVYGIYCRDGGSNFSGPRFSPDIQTCLCSHPSKFWGHISLLEVPRKIDNMKHATTRGRGDRRIQLDLREGCLHVAAVGSV